jgi:hypothetical protein
MNATGAMEHEVFDPKHVAAVTVPDDGWGRLSTKPVVGADGRVRYLGSWRASHPQAAETLQPTKGGRA